jgi:hypothetical protein
MDKTDRGRGHVVLRGEGRGVYTVLVGKPEGKRPGGRPRYRWEDNIKADLQKVAFGSMDWIELDEDRDRRQALVNAGRPGTHCIGGWVCPRAGLDRCGKYCPVWDSIPRPSSL